MVPEGWLNRAIDDNITFSGGSQPPREVFTSEPKKDYIRLIQIRDYKTDKYLTYIPKKMAKKFCTESDVMIGRYGPPIFQILRGIEGAYNVALIKATPKEGVNREFMFYYLNLDSLFRVIDSHSQRTSGQTGIEMDVLKSYPMPLPPLSEQKKIAQILSTWDKAITTTEQLLANSQQQKKALMQQLLTGKKRLLDENGVRFSGEWKKYKLNNIGETFSGLSGKSKSDFGKGTPYIPYKNIFKNSRIDLEELDYVQVNEGERQSAVKFGDIFFTTSSEIIDEVGMSSVLLDEAETLYLNSFCFGFRLNDFEVLTPQFAEHLLRSESSRRKISKLGQGATRYNLSKKQLTNLEFEIPPINEQIKIASVLSNADTIIGQVSKQITRLKSEKKALMQQLLTGKRRVKVDEDAA